MEIEELKRSWEEQGRRLEGALRLNTSLLRQAAVARAAGPLRRLSWLVAGGVLVSLGLAVCLGSFLADHLGEARFLLPAAVLHLAAIALVASGVRQWIALARIDYGLPIVEIQKRLGALAVERVRALELTLLAAPLLWLPLLIVVLKGLAGLDAYALFPASWLAANLAAGAAVIPLAVWAARRLAPRMERSPLARRLLRDLAGYNLAAAERHLAALQSFEREAGLESG